MQGAGRVEVRAQLEDRVQLTLRDYHHLLGVPGRPALLAALDSLERHAGRGRAEIWRQLAGEERYPELVADLITNYYDLTYRKPAQPALQTWHLEPGLMLDQETLIHSQTLDSLLSFGDEYFKLERDRHSIAQAQC